jgi:hypothetical protein
MPTVSIVVGQGGRREDAMPLINTLSEIANTDIQYQFFTSDN